MSRVGRRGFGGILGNVAQDYRKNDYAADQCGLTGVLCKEQPHPKWGEGGIERRNQNGFNHGQIARTKQEQRRAKCGVGDTKRGEGAACSWRAASTTNFIWLHLLQGSCREQGKSNAQGLVSWVGG